jgi:hypothetical protein
MWPGAYWEQFSFVYIEEPCVTPQQIFCFFITKGAFKNITSKYLMNQMDFNKQIITIFFKDMTKILWWLQKYKVTSTLLLTKGKVNEFYDRCLPVNLYSFDLSENQTAFSFFHQSFSLLQELSLKKTHKIIFIYTCQACATGRFRQIKSACEWLNSWKKEKAVWFSERSNEYRFTGKLLS